MCLRIFDPRFSIAIVCTATLLSGCGPEDVQIESRDIAVQESALPAGVKVAPAATAVVSQASPTYVTLTVSKINKFGTAKDHDDRSAVTSGSGFVVEGDGIVMTAAHVAVKTGNVVSVRAANGRIYSGDVINILPGNDMALVRLRGYRGPAVTPISNACLRTGAEVFSLGKPHAEGDTARFGTIVSMSYGQAVQYGAFGYPDAMVLRMNTQKGESGGPLFDGQGKLAGMVVSTLSDGSGQPLNLAHAVPAARLAGFLCQTVSCSPAWSALAQQASTPCPR